MRQINASRIRCLKTLYIFSGTVEPDPYVKVRHQLEPESACVEFPTHGGKLSRLLLRHKYPDIGLLQFKKNDEDVGWTAVYCVHNQYELPRGWQDKTFIVVNKYGSEGRESLYIRYLARQRIEFVWKYEF